MPKGIAGRGDGGRTGIARRQIANRYGLTNAQEPVNFNARPSVTVATNWSPPRAGHWKFVLWAEGAGCASADTLGGGSGAYAEKTVFLSPSQSVVVTLASGFGIGGYNGGTSTIAFPDGSLLRCTGGTRGGAPAGGTATGGDVNLNGSPSNTVGAGTGGGAKPSGGATTGGGAPANQPYRGGDAGSSVALQGSTPGGGACAAGVDTYGGLPLGLAVFLHE
jgi:hypothetical protein